jgi:hypothetical protein
MSNVCYFFTAFTGGTAGSCLDSLDGALLLHGDMAFVKNGENVYAFTLDSGSSATEVSPNVIAPDTNAGTKRWVLQGVRGYITEAVFMPIALAIDGTTAPDAAATLTSTNGKVSVRTFAGDSSEDVRIPWIVPADCYVSDGIRFEVVAIVSAATGPSSEGVAFSLSGYSIGHGDALNGNFGDEVYSNKTAMTEAQYDVIVTAVSSKVTITNMAAGELAMLRFYRDHDHADDTYVQLIGVIGVRLTYTRLIGK